MSKLYVIFVLLFVTLHATARNAPTDDKDVGLGDQIVLHAASPSTAEAPNGVNDEKNFIYGGVGGFAGVGGYAGIVGGGLPLVGGLGGIGKFGGAGGAAGLGGVGGVGGLGGGVAGAGGGAGGVGGGILTPP